MTHNDSRKLSEKPWITAIYSYQNKIRTALPGMKHAKAVYRRPVSVWDFTFSKTLSYVTNTADRNLVYVYYSSRSATFSSSSLSTVMKFIHGSRHSFKLQLSLCKFELLRHSIFHYLGGLMHLTVFVRKWTWLRHMFLILLLTGEALTVRELTFFLIHGFCGQSLNPFKFVKQMVKTG